MFQLLTSIEVSNLQLLTKNENHNKGGRVSNGIGRNGQIKYTYYYGNFFDDEEE